MVEVDVHTLQLEVGGTGEAKKISDRHSEESIVTKHSLAIAVETVLGSNLLPIN